MGLRGLLLRGTLLYAGMMGAGCDTCSVNSAKAEEPPPLTYIEGIVKSENNKEYVVSRWCGYDGSTNKFCDEKRTKYQFVVETADGSRKLFEDNDNSLDQLIDPGFRVRIEVSRRSASNATIRNDSYATFEVVDVKAPETKLQ